jgi:hypothetical protein
VTTVCLHVGCFKTGTSHLQATMDANREALRDAGVLWPGRTFGDQVDFAQQARSGRSQARGDWTRVVQEIDAWDGPLAVISMEFLSLAGSAGVARAMKMLEKHRLKVVVTARDLGRVVPAQWQESVQHENDWSYREYLEEITRNRRGRSTAHQHFWARHNWPRIVSTWSKAGPDDVTLVTVPPAGSPRSLLWERFASVIGVQADRYVEPVAVNESLGAASAEVLRYAARSLKAGSYSSAAVRVKKKVLAKTLMAARKAEEPALALPPEWEPWAKDKTERLLDKLRAQDVEVVGDLEELRPHFTPLGDGVVTDPSAIPVEELLAAAGDGLMGMCAELAGKRGSNDD